MINVDKVDKKTIEAVKQGFAYRVMNLEETVGSLKDGAVSVFCYIVYSLREKQYMSAKSFSKIFPAELEKLSRVRYLKPTDFEDIDVQSILANCYETAKDKLHIIAALVFEGRNMYQIINYFLADEYKPQVTPNKGPLTERKVRAALNNERETSFDTIIKQLSLEQKKEFVATIFDLHYNGCEYIEEQACHNKYIKDMDSEEKGVPISLEDNISFLCSPDVILKTTETREIAVLICSGYSSKDIFDFYINLKAPVGTSKPKDKKKSKLPLNKENVDFILKNSEIASKSMEEIIRAVKYNTIAPCPLKIIYKLQQLDRKKVFKRDTFKYLFHSKEQVIQDRINSYKIGGRQELIKDSDFPIDQLSENLKLFDNIELALIREILMVCYQGYAEKEVLTYYKGCLENLEFESLSEEQIRHILKNSEAYTFRQYHHKPITAEWVWGSFTSKHPKRGTALGEILYRLQRYDEKDIFDSSWFDFLKREVARISDNDLSKYDFSSASNAMLIHCNESIKPIICEMGILLYEGCNPKNVYNFYSENWGKAGTFVQVNPLNKEIIQSIVERSSHSNNNLTQLIYCFSNVKQDIIDDFCIILFMLQLRDKNVFIADEFQNNFQNEIKIYYKEIEQELTGKDLTNKLNIMLKISYESSKPKFREILLLLFDDSYSKQEVYEYYKKHWEDS